MSFTDASLIVASSKSTLPHDLNTAIAMLSIQALKARNAFVLAVSGGSLPQFMAGLAHCFVMLNVDPQFEKWHVVLADERCVPIDDDDSNMKAIRKSILHHTSIPEDQVYGIDTSLLSQQDDSTSAIAKHYEATLRKVLQESGAGGMIDLALLGFGPDGHTCSLFPDHPLLKVANDIWVAPIEDSPKPPAKRITLTLPVLNGHTRHVIVCGAGTSKGPVIQKVFQSVKSNGPVDDTSDYGKRYKAILSVPAPFPCGMIRPQGDDSTLTWIVDEEAFVTAGFFA